MTPAAPPPSPLRLLVGLLVLAFTLVMAAEYLTIPERHRRQEGSPEPVLSADALRFADPYLEAREHVVDRLWVYGPAAILTPLLVFAILRRFAKLMNTWREELAGMALVQPSHHLPNPVARGAASPAEDIERTQRAFIQALESLEDPESEVLLGLDREGEPVILTDRQRSMHMQILGQTGSGKTQSVIYPLLFQDARRPWTCPRTQAQVRRPLAFIDAKGSVENEEMLASIAQATGRLSGLRILSLNPGRPTHSYNPLYLAPGDDPRQIAERVFSTFEDDLDVQYYKDMARELWVNLISALAATGKQVTMLDTAAAIADPDIMAHALSLSSDKAARRAIESRYAQLGKKQGETYTGLLAAVNRYDHPAVNVYNPDIKLDELFEEGGMVGFSLSANAYKYQAKALGLIVLQHIQHIGAQRQMDRNRSQAPATIFADEFYTFAYPGFIDAVNKLRDANLSMVLSHQSMSDLELVSKEFARGIWDNTRNRIVLYQSDAELCERVAAGVGTQKNVVLTVRRRADGFLNQESSLEASSRAVDEFILHPNQIKSLRMGQAYLIQSGLAQAPAPARRWGRATEEGPAATVAVGVNLALMPALPKAVPPPPAERDTTSGIGLHKLFIGQGAAA